MWWVPGIAISSGASAFPGKDVLCGTSHSEGGIGAMPAPGPQEDGATEQVQRLESKAGGVWGKAGSPGALLWVHSRLQSLLRGFPLSVSLGGLGTSFCSVDWCFEAVDRLTSTLTFIRIRDHGALGTWASRLWLRCFLNESLFNCSFQSSRVDKASFLKLVKPGEQCT